MILFYFTLFLLLFALVAFINKARNLSKLKNELAGFPYAKTIIALKRTEIQLTENYNLIEVSEKELLDENSLVRRLMKHTGQENLPCSYWLDENRKIRFERV